MVIDAPKGASPDLLASLGALPEVEEAFPNHIYHIDAAPNDSLYIEQWALRRVHAEEAWDITRGDSTTLVGIIDTGIDFYHPDLVKSIAINRAEDINGNGHFDPWPKDSVRNGVKGDLDLIDQDGNGYADDVIGYDFIDQTVPNLGDWSGRDPNPDDEQGHGTNVAGVIAAQQNNRVGISGLAPGVRLVALRAFDATGNGEDDDISAAIVYAADRGLKVVNMSFGDTYFSPLMSDAVQYAYSRGVTLVASSGNAGGYDPHYPSNYPRVISVGATDSLDYLSLITTYGSQMTIVAPGVDIITTAVDSNYKRVGGTSFSSPHVAAAAALLLSLHPTWKPDEVRTALELGSDDLGVPGWDQYYAAGRLNVRRTLESPGPASIAILSPEEDSGFRGDSVVEVLGSAMSPFIKWWQLSIGYGPIPKEWIPITDTMRQGKVMDRLATFNTSSLPDTLVQLRLLLTQTNNRQTERRIRLHVDRTRPRLAGSDSLDIRNVWRFEERAVAITLRSDDLTRAVAWIRRSDQPNAPYRAIEHEPERTGLMHSHFLLLTSREMEPSIPYDLYIQLRNTAGDTVLVGSPSSPLQITRERAAFPLTTMNLRLDSSDEAITPRSLPYGYTLNSYTQFYGDNQECLALNRFDGSDFGKLAIFSFNGRRFVERDTTKDIWIPRGIGDSDGDGRREVLGQSRGMLRVFEQAVVGGNPLARVKYSDTTSQNAWASGLYDFDGDGKSELIARTDNSAEEPGYFYISRWNGTTYQKFAKLENPTPPALGDERNKFGSPETVVQDFNGDGRADLLFGDDDGDFVVYAQQADGSFKHVWSDVNDGTGGSEMIAAGDIDGDGKSEIIVSYHSSLISDNPDREYEAPFWTVKIFSLGADGSALLRWSDRFAYIRPPSPFRSGMIAGDLDRKKGDEVVISIFPNLYVFHWDSVRASMEPFWWAGGAVNNRPLLHDFDKDGYAELGVGTSSGFVFFQVDPSYHGPQPPAGIQGWSLNDSTAFVGWNTVDGATGYNVYRGVVKPGAPTIELQRIVSATTTTRLVDTGLGLPEGRLAARTNYIYLVTSVDPGKTPQESGYSIRADVYTHPPARIVAAYPVGGRSIRVAVSASASEMLYRPGAFDVRSLSGESVSVNSVLAANDTTLVMTLHEARFGDTLLVRLTELLHDVWNTPADTSSSAMVVMPPGEAPGERFIATRAFVVGGDTIAVDFNMPVDQALADDLGKYQLDPNGALVDAFMLGDNPQRVYLVASPDFPFGPLGKNYTVTINDLRSDDGRLINDGAGSVVGFTINAENFDNVFAYPQPYSLSQDESLTFAGLTARVAIHIFTTTGQTIRSLESREGNGGARWDGRDEAGKPVPTGIYLYRVIAIGSDGEDLFKSEPKKIAVVR
jgi:subtilisin family serine protease